MSSHNKGESLKSMVMGLSAEDWQLAGALAPGLESTLRQITRVHKAQPIFNKNGSLAVPVRKRVSELRVDRLTLAVGPLLGALRARLDGLEQDSPGDVVDRLGKQPEVGHGLARLAAEHFQVPDFFMPPTKAAVDEQASRGAQSSFIGTRPSSSDLPDADPESPGERASVLQQSDEEVADIKHSISTFKSIVDDLQVSHWDVVESARSAGRLVEAGEPVADEDLHRMTQWNARLAAAAALTRPSESARSLASLIGVLEQLELEAGLGLSQSLISDMLEGFRVITISSGAEEALSPILRAAGEREGSDLTEEELAAYAALGRLLLVPAFDVVDEDASLVERKFGRRTMVIAAGEVVDPVDPAFRDAVRSLPTGEGDSDPAERPTQAGPSDVVPADADGPSQTIGTPQDDQSDPEPQVDELEAPDVDTPSANVEQAEEPAIPSSVDEVGQPSAPGRRTPTANLDQPLPGPSQLQEEPNDQEQVPPRSTADAESSRVGIADLRDRLPLQEEAKDVAEAAVDIHIRDALVRGNAARAYWYAVASDAPKHIRDTLEVLALSEAITVDGDDCAMRVREIFADYDVFAAAEGNLLKVVAAAAGRVALRMPFSPATSVLDDACELLGDDCPRFLEAIRQASRHGVELGAVQQQVKSLPEAVSTRDEAIATLALELTLLSQRRTRAHRATTIWRQLLATKGRLGSVVSPILAGGARLEDAQVLLAELHDNKDIDRLIDELDAEMHPVAAGKSKIISRARDDLRELIQALLVCLQTYVRAEIAVQQGEKQRRTTDTTDVLGALAREASAQSPAEPATDPGDAVLMRTKRWIDDILQRRTSLPKQAMDPRHVLARDLALGFEVQRGADGLVQRESVTLDVLARLDRRTPDDAYMGLVAQDDHAGVEHLTDVLRDTGRELLADEFIERQRDDLKVSRERLSILLEQTDRELSLARATALLTESEHATLRAEVERIRAEQSVVDFPAARRELGSVVARVDEARRSAVEVARRQLAAVTASESAVARIEGLLDQGDLVNAQEFLAQLEAGAQELPREVDADETLRQFWPAFTESLEAQSASATTEVAEADLLESLARKHAEIGGMALAPESSSSNLLRGLEGWLFLARSKRQVGYQEHLKHVLGMLGLELNGHFDESERGDRLRWWTTFTATQVGQALVAEYGSACRGQYQLLLSWDRLSPGTLLDLVKNRPGTRPTIILSFHTLTTRERRALAERSRPSAENVSAVVVDPAVVAFLSTRQDPALHTALGITLPFTSVNPYTPFVLGDVPPEVFYGRKTELRRVQDPQDALFVYGGRQLGKSALLKTAQREFQRADDRWRSIFIDLKAEGIGEWRQPDDIWSVLVPHLVAEGVLDAKTTKAQPDAIVAGVRRWLDADESRRLLLLLDEADAFLGTDAQPRPDAVGEARFVNVYRLKSLMDGSSRRFKPVFAGLHQVQRFHSTSNGPMAHVGAEIPIGPLPPTEAFKLVVKPLAAIGYHFESPDAVWRLLNYTNYHASLIQLFCDALVRRLHERKLGAKAPPTTVTRALVEEVYGGKELRDQIADRFEWTINLDPRYRVIAYATAWLSVSGDEQLFSPMNLHDECSTFWPDGFRDLTLDEFVAYLDELEGLGVLVRTPGDEYTIRSPNVTRLLGSREEIERRLMESDKLELSPSFDPAWYRRALQGDPNMRSPIPEQQLKRILEDGSQVHVLTGTPALGIERVPQALSEAADDTIEVHEASAESLQGIITELARTKGRRHIVLDLQAVESSHNEALDRLRRQLAKDDRLTASVLVAPGFEQPVDSGEFAAPLNEMHVLPWNQASLKAWAPECDYRLASHAEREEMLDATGGWPELVESVVVASRRGTPASRARQKVSEALEEPGFRRDFLDRVGIIQDTLAEQLALVVANWSDDVTYADLSELVEWAPDDLIGAVNALVDMSVLGRSASGDTYRLNSLVARLLKAES